MSDPRPLSEVVLDLEVRLAYQDHTLATLDGVLRTLFARVEALEKEVRELRKGASLAIGPANEPPPHY